MNPLIFIVIFVVADLLIKSGKEKKKIEAEKQKRMKKVNTTSIEEKILKDKKRVEEERARIRKEKDAVPGGREYVTEYQRDKIKEEDRRQKEKLLNTLKGKEKSIYDDEKYQRKIVTEDLSQEKNISIDIGDDIIKGIIFSEILSEPKSRK